MSERMKMLITFAILGFIAGVIANFSARILVPWLLEYFPLLLRADWILSGLAGAFLTILVVMIWAWVSPPSEKV